MAPTGSGTAPHAKLDRIRWDAVVGFRSHGLCIGLRATRAELIARLVECLPPGAEPTPGEAFDQVFSVVSRGSTERATGRESHASYAGHDLLARARELERVLPTLRAAMKLFVAEHAPERVFVHAGVVELAGRALVLPGRTFTGKSTLVHALCAAGARYYSDEFAVFRPDGLVEPYLQPLNLRGTHCDIPVPVESLPGGTEARPPLVVDRVVFCRHRAGRRSASFRTLTRGTAILEFLRHTPATRLAPERALATLARVVETAERLEIGVRGDATPLATAWTSTLRATASVGAR